MERGQALEQLSAAIDAVLAIDPDTLSDSELEESVVALQQQTSRLAAGRAHVVGAWDARRVWARQGAWSARAWLRRHCTLEASAARREVRRARQLRHMPAAARALAAGTITVAHADTLGRVCTPERAGLFARDEAVLVDQAQRLATFRIFARAVGYWASLADDEVGIEPTERLIRNRSLTLGRDAEGNVIIRGVADPLSGAVIEEELNRLARLLAGDDWNAARDQWGTDAADHIGRSWEQRRFDALVEMARRSAGAEPDVASPRPLFTVVVDYATFTGRVCELFNGLPVPPGAVARWLSQADIERVVFDGASRILDVGARRRFFTGALRRAIEVRDRHCTHPEGCDVPAGECDVDHIVPWSQGGETTQDNGRLRCPPHNRHADNTSGRAPPDDRAA